jgi:hypothetical protein
MSVSSSLNLGKNAIAFNKLSKNSLVAIEPVSGAKGYSEFRSVLVLSLAHSGEHSALVVAESKIAINVETTEGSVSLFAGSSTLDAEASHSLVKG